MNFFSPRALVRIHVKKRKRSIGRLPSKERQSSFFGLLTELANFSPFLVFDLPLIRANSPLRLQVSFSYAHFKFDEALYCFT